MSKELNNIMNDNDTTEPHGAWNDFATRLHLGQPWGTRWLRFERDMARLGLEVEECHGPNGWGGPAVPITAGTLQDVVRATDVRLEWHAEGENVVIYPATVWV